MAITIPVDFDADASGMTKALDSAADAGERVANSIGSSIAADLDKVESSAKGASRGLESVGDAAGDTASTSAQVAGGIGDLGGALAATGVISEGTAGSLDTASQVIMGVTGAADLAEAAFAKMKLGQIAATAVAYAQAAATAVASAATTVFTGVVTAAGIAVQVATGPIGLIILALVAFVAAIVIAYKNSETFRDIVNSAFSAIKSVVMPIINAIGNVVSSVFGGLKDVATATLGAFKAVIGTQIELVKAIFTGDFSKVKEIIDGVWEKIKSAVGTAWTGIKTAVTEGVGKVVDVIQDIPGKISDLGGKMLEAGKGLMTSLFNGISNAAGAAGGFVAEIAGKIRDGINDLLNLPLTIGPLSVAGKQILGQVTVIPRFAQGTDFAPGGMALVGEEGPELVDLPRGSKVHTAEQTSRMMDQRPITINVHMPTGDPEAAAAAVMNRLASMGR